LSLERSEVKLTEENKEREVKKVFIAFDQEDMVTLESIKLDKDPKEALEFVLKNVYPRVEKKAPCLGQQGMGIRK